MEGAKSVEYFSNESWDKSSIQISFPEQAEFEVLREYAQNYING